MNRRNFFKAGTTIAVLLAIPLSVAPKCDAMYIESTINKLGFLPPGNYTLRRPIIISAPYFDIRYSIFKFPKNIKEPMITFNNEAPNGIMAHCCFEAI